MFDWFHHGEGLSVFNLEGLCDPAGPPVSAAGHAIRRILPGRGSRRRELRPQVQDHPQPVQRQPGPVAPQGDGARLGRRPDRGRGPVPARPRRAQLRRDARALQGLQRHRRRPSPEPRRDHPRPQRLHADPRGTYKEWVLDYVGAWRAADDRQRRDHPDQHRPRRQDRRRLRRQVVRRRLRLGIHRHRPGHTAGPRIAIDITSGSTASATRSCSPATTASSTPGASRSTRSIPTRRSKAAGRSTRTCTAIKAGTTTGPSRTGPARSSSTTGR